jgi:hypothetical protein
VLHADIHEGSVFTGERGPETEVPAAGAERLVLGFARQVEAVGVLEARLIAIGQGMVERR